jgi:hypothetical protein
MLIVQQRVSSYSVTHLKNDIVNFHQIVRLTTETGHHAFIAFMARPPAQWLTFADNASNVFLQLADFEGVHRTLQTESPVFYTAIEFIGLRAFNLTTDVEPPGEGPADGDALAQFMARVRQHLAESEFRLPDSGGVQDSYSNMCDSEY